MANNNEHLSDHENERNHHHHHNHHHNDNDNNNNNNNNIPGESMLHWLRNEYVPICGNNTVSYFVVLVFVVLVIGSWIFYKKYAHHVEEIVSNGPALNSLSTLDQAKQVGGGFSKIPSYGNVKEDFRAFFSSH